MRPRKVWGRDQSLREKFDNCFQKFGILRSKFAGLRSNFGSLRSKFDNSDSKFDVFCAKVWGFPAGKFDVEFELER